jgi:hypothetical protein
MMQALAFSFNSAGINNQLGLNFWAFTDNTQKNKNL